MVVDAIRKPASVRRRRSIRELVDALRAKAAEVVATARTEPPSDEMRVSGSRVNLPNWLVLYLLAQIVSSVWWAATKEAQIAYLQTENLKLWQKVETHDLQMGKLDKVVRDAVKEAMEDADYVRVGRKGD